MVPARFTLVGLLLASLLGITCGDETVDEALPPLDIPADADCDPLVPEVCGMPFPSSKWLVPDTSRATGYTLTFGATTLPKNAEGVHVDPAPYRRLDGFGVGAPAVAFFPDLDGQNLPNEDHIAETMEPGSPVAMFEERAGALVRIPCFAEIDGRSSDEQRSLIVRPAVLLREGTRYVVALRALKHRDGTPVTPSDAFVALRDGRAAGTPVADRAERFDAMFGQLEANGIDRKDLVLAWDWTTASHETLHGPLLHMRDQSFAELGDASPAFTITSITTYTEQENPLVAYEVLGTVAVPDYTTPFPVGTKMGHVLAWGDDGLPHTTGVYQAEFRARVPRSALGGDPHGVMMHGHGLNGTHAQIGDDWDAIASREKVVIVGANMIGMSSEDVPGILEIVHEFSRFPALADRLHQGVLDHAFLVRGMKTGFDDVPEIAATGLVVDPTRIFYEGISQGGIFGATHVAMSLDVTRGHLGVPGNNYSTLLQRSVDFSPFFALVSLFYPDARDQQVLLAAVQGLWDRTDPVSHYRHLSAEPHPGTPPHQVLLASAKADWQVANLTNEIVARSDVGVGLMPGYGRDVPLVTPTPYPFVGSGVVNYDFGNPWPPPGNTPPQDDVGDPHGKPRQLAHENEQMFHFFDTGEIIDVCGGNGCTPD